MELLRVSPRDPKAWKSAIDTLNSFLTEGTLHFTDKGVWLQALDPSQVVFVSMDAPKSFFSLYDLKHPEVKVPISLNDFQRILSRLGTGETLTLSFSSTNLYIYMEGPSVRKEFILPAINVSESTTTVTMPQSLSRVKVPAQYLKDALKNASIVSRHVIFKVSDDSFIVEARESSNVSRTVIGVSPAVSISSDKDSMATYSIDYLQNILKGAEDEVILEYSTDSPLKISYNLQGIRMTFILAPLIL